MSGGRSTGLNSTFTPGSDGNDGEINRRSLHCAALRSRRQSCGNCGFIFPRKLKPASQQLCRLDRSAAQWRDLRFTFPVRGRDRPSPLLSYPTYAGANVGHPERVDDFGAGVRQAGGAAGCSVLVRDREPAAKHGGSPHVPLLSFPLLLPALPDRSSHRHCRFAGEERLFLP
jgi:hypothetical protein